MIILKNGEVVEEYLPEYSGRKIVIGIDSSKSDSAIAVGDEFGNILADYEIRGGGSDVDVYDLCAYTRIQLRQLFKGADIQLVGIEDIITKNEKGYKGIDIHQSRYKITAVFDNFIFLFDEFFKVRPKRVNNWDWKHTVLPEEYRKKTHKKGSKDFFDDLGGRWAGRNDNVTDAVCILTYLYKKNPIKPVYDVTETTPSNVPYEFAILPASMEFDDSVREYRITNTDSIEHNISTIAGRLDKGKLAFFKANLRDIPIEWIYSEHLKITEQCKFTRVEHEVSILVGRK